MSKPTTADILKRKKPATASETILLDESLVDQRTRLQARVADARNVDQAEVGLRDGKGAVELEQELAELEAVIRDQQVTFTFQALGSTRLRAMLAEDEHRPTDAQKADGWDEFNPDTFPAAIIAEASLEPTITLDEATIMMNEWSESEVAKLFSAAWGVQRRSRTVPFGNLA